MNIDGFHSNDTTIKLFVILKWNTPEFVLLKRRLVNTRPRVFGLKIKDYINKSKTCT